MVRKVFIGILIGIIVLVVTLIIFVNTFNINRYLPQITAQAGQAVGRSVNIEGARLHFSPLQGVSASVRGISISEDPAVGAQPFLTVQQIRCGVRLLPLITKRQVEVSYILIDAPVVNLIKDKSGRFNFESMIKTTSDHSSSPGASTGPGGSSPAPAPADLPLLLVNSFQLQNARVIYVDHSSTPPVEFTASDIHVEVTDFSLTEPFKVKGEASLLSGRPNVHFNSLVRVDVQQQQVRLDDAHMDVDVSSIDVKKLNNTVASLEPAGIQNLKGHLTAVASQMLAGTGGLLVLSMEAQFSDGQVKLKALTVPVDNITMKMDASESRINLKDFSFHLASGEVHGQGTVKDYLSAQNFNFSFDVNRIALGDLIDQKNYPAQVKGWLSGHIKLNGRGFTPEALNAMTGQSEFNIADGEVANMNILKTVLDGLNAIPGLGDLENRLPADLRQKLASKNTPIDRADVKARIEQSSILVDNAQLQAQGFGLSANGTVGFDQTVAMDAQMVLFKELTAALISFNKELSVLADENQEIRIPVKIKGKGASVTVMPDVNDLSKRLLVQEGSKQLEKVIEKNPGVKQILNILTGGDQSQDQTSDPSDNSTQEPASQQNSSPEKKLLEIFKGF